MDFARNLLGVSLFMSEGKAQELAVKLRQRAPVGIVVTAVSSVVASGLRSALSGRMHHRVRIVHPAVAPEQSHGQVLQWLPDVVLRKLEEKLIEWVGRSVAEHFLLQTQDFVAASEADADGVTVTVTLSDPPGLPKIRRVLGGEPVVLRGKWFSEGVPDATIKFLPGN